MDRDEDRDEALRALARIGAATEGITPDPQITDALLEAAREACPAEDPLAGIARATGSLDPGDAFSEAIVARAAGAHSSEQGGAASAGARASAGRGAPAERSATSWLDGVVRTGPVAVGVAALAAAASFVLFLASERDVEAALASSVDTVEVSE